ncbi:MAG: hypothetical protein CME10_07950 [Gemmatimonadetes bacterium]|nr:hypothetical protein [Gemmatimonadota bacterium]
MIKLFLSSLFALMFYVDMASAHKLNTSYANLVIRQDTLMLRFRIDDYDMAQLGLDTNGDSTLFFEEMSAGLPEVADFVSREVEILVNDKPVPLQLGKTDINPDDKGNTFAIVYLGGKLDAIPVTAELKINFFDEFGSEHKSIGKVLMPGHSLEQVVFSNDTRSFRFGEGNEKTLFQQSMLFTWLGIEHIFIGYDHIMFLLALIIVGGRLRDMVKIVSAFTVAHSITLCLAALEIVSLPGKWIEAAIALSIAYVAVENLFLKQLTHRWLLTFGFGLIHGFGFANVLRELGLPAKGLAVSLFSFNVGVELGQVAIVGIVFPVIVWLSHQVYQRRVVDGLSLFILLFGLGWLIERIFDLEYMPL